MIEHRYPDGNQLTLRLIAALTTDGDGLAPGSIVVSIYEVSGDNSFPSPYLVRGHVVTFGVSDKPTIEGRIANGGGVCKDLDTAWKAARVMFGQLAQMFAAYVEEPGGAS